MLDMIKISIPFSDDFLLTTKLVGDDIQSYVDLKECSRRGVTLEARSISFSCFDADSSVKDEDKYEIGELRHPYETLPTSYTGIAFKIFAGTRLRPPCIELKASPAKILQGHNVYGSTVIKTGAFEMLIALQHSYPDLYEMLDVENTLLDGIDCTYSARAKNSEQVKQIISHLKNISHKQMRQSVKSNNHETTCYFSRGSRHCDRKGYSKYDEFKNQLNSLRKNPTPSNQKIIDVMSNPDLLNFAMGLIRLEASAKRRYLDDFNVPKKLFDAIKFQEEYEKDGKSLVADIFKKAFSPLFEALKGEKMNIFNDEEVRNKLNMEYSKITPKGNISYAKADRIFRFYRSLISDGYDSVLSSFSKSNRKSFYNQLNPLLAIGVSKAQLQNLKGDGKDNVIPLLQVLEIDFSNQRPSNWVEPKAPILSAYESGDFENINNVVAIRAA